MEFIEKRGGGYESEDGRVSILRSRVNGFWTVYFWEGSIRLKKRVASPEAGMQFIADREASR